MKNSGQSDLVPEKKQRAPNKRASKPRDASRHSIRRYLDMLQLIPRGPASISTKEIFDRLITLGYDVSLKTIQRDLMNFMNDEDYCLIYAEKNSGYNWSYLPGTRSWVFPAGMEENVALAVVMANKFLAPVMPDAFGSQPSISSTQERIANIRTAQNLISRRDNDVSQWIDKVHIMPLEFVRPTPSIDPEIKETVYAAIQYNFLLWIQYKAYETADVEEYYVKPLGLIYRGHVVYLVAMDDENGQIRYFALHRIVYFSDCVEGWDGTFDPPPGFNLKTYAEKEFGLGGKEADTLLITLRLDKDAKADLEDCPIADGQKLQPMEGGWFKLMATVPNSLELRRFIRSYCAQVEVLGPEALRKEFADTASTLATYYSGK